MVIRMMSLRSWIESQYKSYPQIPEAQRKEETAHELGVGIATIYRWLKAGNVYVQLVGSEDDAALVIWKEERIIES